jgi:hypothetical protein
MEKLFESLLELLKDNWLAISALTISAMAYRSSKRTHSEFLNNTARAKQFEAVQSLISRLHESKVEIWFFQGAAGSGNAVKYNVFEIAALLNNKTKNINVTVDYCHYDDVQVLFSPNSEQIFDIVKFIDNPFIPQKIADELINFHNSGYELIDAIKLMESDKKYVKINSRISFSDATQRSGKLIEGDMTSSMTWLNLKEHSNKLSQLLRAWFSENGVKDVNIRDDFK